MEPLLPTGIRGVAALQSGLPTLDQPGFQIRGEGRLLGSKETLTLPLLRLWLAATVTSPPPRRAVSWEMGVGESTAPLMLSRGGREARQGVSPRPFSAQCQAHRHEMPLYHPPSHLL